MRRAAAALTGACAAVATLAATMTGLAPASAAPDRPAGVGDLVWKTCADADLKDAGAQCGTLTVPLDYDDPDGKKVHLAISRIKATAPAAKRQGPMLVNPGGPGGSGLTLPLYFDSALPEKVASRFDIIGFDPRGVGESSPLDCGSNVWRAPQPAYRPVTGRYGLPGPDEVEWLKRADDFVADCADAEGDRLAHMGTAEVVSDMDAIRAALGASKISYYGFSYGTTLGQNYATRYPNRLHRLVLDANVDPSTTGYESQPVSSKAFEKVMQLFFAWTAKYDRVYHLGDTRAEVEERYYEDEADLREDPLPKFGPSEWNDNFTFTAGYADYLWPDLASVWSKWRFGDREAFLDFADDGSTAAEQRNSTASFLTVTCLDGRWPHDYDTWRSDAFDSAEVAPFRTWSDVMSGLPCRVWPVPGRAPVEIGDDGVDGLVLGSTLDSPTPFTGSLEVRRVFPRSALVALVGSINHGVSLGGNDCIDGYVTRYLLSGTLPDRDGGDGPDATCKNGPAPKPSKEDLRAARNTTYAEGGEGGEGGDGGNGGGGGGGDGADGKPGGTGAVMPLAAWLRTNG